MESAILQHTGRISSRLSKTALLLLACCAPATASTLFSDDAVLDVSLSGPLGTISKNRKEENRTEYPFVLTVDEVDVPVMVRVRGHSRTHYCSFPPLRLRFHDAGKENTLFQGEGKLKLVTHCRNNKEHFENNLLDEYSAYRIFNLISEAGYRVRLLRIAYEDTDNRHRDLDRPYFGFLIESDDGLAERLGGHVAELSGVVFSRLNEVHMARVNVFQYLIANADWSLVTGAGEQNCCHNIDLIEKDGELFAVPYDFDMAGIVNASYAKLPDEVRARTVTSRIYRGYCRSSIEVVADALETVVGLRDAIVSVAATVPTVGRADAEKRAAFVDGFFREAIKDRDKLVEKFDRDCIGKR